jgi:hypothetical protein
MKIIHNPVRGAPIIGFIHEGILLEPLYPEGSELPGGGISKGLMQYEDVVAQALKETFEFLVIVNPDQAKRINDKKHEKKFKCEFPECEGKFESSVDLEEHSKNHMSMPEKSMELAIGPDIVPVATGRKIPSLAEQKKMSNNEDDEIRNGRDKDNVEWYGDGAKVVNNSAQAFAGIRTPGKGHFKG